MSDIYGPVPKEATGIQLHFSPTSGEFEFFKWTFGPKPTLTEEEVALGDDRFTDPSTA